MPIDLRPEYANENVGGTIWRGCKTDSIWTESAPAAIRERLSAEISESKLFQKILNIEESPNDFHLKTNIHTFCGDTRRLAGMLRITTAGSSAINFVLERNGKIIFQRKYEKVITNFDPEYSNFQFASQKTGRTHVMADSFRVLLKDFLPQLQEAITESMKK